MVSLWHESHRRQNRDVTFDQALTAARLDGYNLRVTLPQQSAWRVGGQMISISLRCRLLPGIVVAVMGTIPAVAQNSSSATSVQPPLVLHIVDTGIMSPGDRNPWNPKPVFGGADAPVFVKIPMPPDSELLSKSPSDLRAEIEQKIASQIRPVVGSHNRFEIRLIESVNIGDYLKPDPNKKQELADRFGRAAYGAVADLLKSRELSGRKADVYVSVASNGVGVLSRTIGVWAKDSILSQIRQVDLVNGRASPADVIAAARLVGGEKVNLYVSHWDYWAGPNSVGRQSGAEQVFAKVPSVHLLLIQRVENDAYVNHIALLLDRSAEFNVQVARPDAAGQYFQHAKPVTMRGDALISFSGATALSNRSVAPISPPAQPSRPTSLARPMGGIQLNTSTSGAALRGVIIDSVGGNIILIGERNFVAQGLSHGDLAMALWLEFGPAGQDPQFSLDPDSPSNPRGPWLRAVYIPALLQGRSFGSELYEGDLRLKELSFQTELRNGKLEPWTSKTAGFKSYAQLAMDTPQASSSPDQWARFWIVADRVTAKRWNNTILFDAQMAVRARRQVPDPRSPTGLRDVDTAANTLEAQWARLFSARYDDLAQESPSLARVAELAKAVAIARTLRESGAQVDLARVAAIVNADHTPTVARVNAFAVSWQREQRTPFHNGLQQGVRIERRVLRLFGGVDLSVHPVAIADDGVAHGVSDSAMTALRAAGSGAEVIHFQYNHTPLVAVVLPHLLKAQSR